MDSLPVHYEERGSGTPLLMLHGRNADHRQMLADMEPLFAERTGWRRIYPDLPGMGRTPGAGWITRQDQVLDIVTGFLDVVVPEQRFVAAGASYGGYIALGLIHRRRAMVDGLALIVPAVERDRERRRLPLRQVLVEDTDFLDALTPEESQAKDFFVVQSREALEALRSYVEPAFEAADHPFLDRLFRSRTFSFDVRDLDDALEVPALVLAGRQDSLVGYLDAWTILERLPRATFAVLDRAGHALGIEQRSLFRSLTGEWLDRVREYIESARG
ncbi:MAG: alpha/beta hydrolase [Deinococcales bacterium]